MNNNNLTTLKVRVEHIVSYITYSCEYQTKIVQGLIVNRVLELVKDKDEVTDDEIKELSKKLIFKHKYEFRRNSYDLTTSWLLLDTLKKFNFSGSLKDRLIIENIVEHALLEFPITKEEMEKTIIAVAQYCFDRNENDYEHYKKYLLKSKVLKKCSPPMQVFELLAQRFVDEFGQWLDKPNTDIDYNEIPSSELDTYLKVCGSCPKAKECHENCVTCEKRENTNE